MKKFLSIVLALMMLLPICAMAEESPTLESLWHSTPELQVRLIKNDDEAFEYLELIATYYDLDGFNEMVLGTDEYALVDMVVVTLDKTYKKVLWATPYNFGPHDNLCVFMISTDMLQGYVMSAKGDKNGNLVVNYNHVAPGTYFMIIYAAEAHLFRFTHG